MSINKSPIQFYDADKRFDSWPTQLEANALSGTSIVVEITEGMLLDNNPMIIEQFNSLRDHNIQVALDDFGTGYSSLAYLKKFDIDYLKIDQSFVRNLDSQSEDGVLCEAIIVMAHKLGIKVIAEGVETLEQFRLLKDMGCDFGQGYYFSRPVNSDVFSSYLNDNLCF
ncbi:EAL domain-containing protein [Methylocucumis oryzae]|uniref:EAL domain-containing protein n=1 Tax=Methylocucumis oryzae TaxID=1632867 RepID=UPI0009E3C59E